MVGGNAKKKMRIGIENFEEIRKEGFYYVDKTGTNPGFTEQLGESEPVYQTPTFWKNVEYMNCYNQITHEGLSGNRQPLVY